MTKCQTVTPPNKDACGKPATYRVLWRDGESFACTDCAIYLKQLGEEHRAPPSIRKLPVARQA